MKGKTVRYLLTIAVFFALTADIYAAPAGILDLTGLASQAVEGDVTLAWTAPDTMDSSPTPSGYLIKVSTSEVNWADFYAAWVSTYNYNWTVFAASGTSESVTLTGLTPGETFNFAVVAIDSSGVLGPWSSSSDTGGLYNTLSYAVLYDTIPAQTTGLSLGYGNNTIDIQWQANTEIDIAGYKVQCSSFSESAGFSEIADVLKPGTTFQHSELVNGNTYYYRVRAYDARDHYGFYSTVSSTRPWISLAAPSWNASYSLTVSTSSINWAWNTLTAAASGYRIINSTSGVVHKEALTPGDTYWLQAGLTPNASNTMLLEVFNGFVTRSSPARIYHTYAIEPVEFTTTTVSSRLASLEWKHGANAEDTSYIIRRSSTNWSDFKTISGLSPGATSYFETDLIEGATFSYNIWGINGEGVQSAAFTGCEFVTIRINPGQPVLSADCTTWINDGTVRLRWSVPQDDDGDPTSGRCASYMVKWSSAPIAADEDFDAIPVSSSALVPDNGISDPVEKIVTGLYPGTTFYFALKAVDRTGNYSALSNAVNIVAQDTMPDPPSAVTAVPLSSSSVSVAWTNPVPVFEAYDDRSQYVVYRATYDFFAWQTGISSFTVSHPATYYIDAGLSAETTYYYRLKTGDKGDIGGGYFSDVYLSTFSAVPAVAYTPDMTRPDAVSAITAFTGATEGKINLAWTSTGDNGPAGTITNGKFRIDYSTDSLCEFSTSFFKLDITTTTSPGDVNFATISGLMAGTTYYFRIWAADEWLNWSGLSTGATAFAQHDVTPPSAVNAITATPLWRRVMLNWTSPGDDEGVGITTGTVEIRNTNSGPITNQSEWDSVSPGFPHRIIFTTGISQGDAKAFIVTGLSNGTTYYFAIRSRDEMGNQSGISSVSPSAVPVNHLPSQFMLTGPADNSILASSSALTWQLSGDAIDALYGDTILYRVYRSTNPDFTAPVAQTDTGADNFNLDITPYEDKTVYWKVEALDRDAVDFSLSGTTSSPVSQAVRVNVYNVPPGDFSLSAPADASNQPTTDPALSWSASLNSDPGDSISYKVDLSMYQDFSVLISSDGIPTSAYTPQGLAENTTYWWRVWADDGVFTIMSLTTGYFRINAVPEQPAPFDLTVPGYGEVVDTTTVSFSWNTTSDPDPDETVSYDLIWSELANFSSSSTVSGLTLSATDYQGFAENGVYYWRVFAVDSSPGQLRRQSNQTNMFYVDSIKELPGTFILQEPGYNVIVSTTLRPLFNWSKAVDPDPADEVRYVFEMSQSANFTGPGTLSADTGTDRYYMPLADLEDQATYYWRVKASGYRSDPLPVQVDPSYTESAVSTFTVSITNYPPEAFTLAAPADGARATSKKPLLVWNQAEDRDTNSVVYYAVSISSRPDFSPLLESSQNIYDTKYQVTSTLEENKTYYWKVEATDNKGATRACSSAYNFIIPVLNTPQVPMGLRGTLSSDKLKFTIAWSAVDKNSDGTPLDDLAAYRIYRGSDRQLTLYATVASSAGEWTDESMMGVEYFYRVSAVDSSGIESVLEDSPLLNSRSPETQRLMSDDKSLIIYIPEQVTRYLLAENNPYSRNLRIKFEHNPAAEDDKVVSSYYVRMITAEDSTIERFSFGQPLTLKFGYGVATYAGKRLAASKVPVSQLGDLGVYWNNGIEYMRVGGTVLPADQQVVLKANRSGEYQLRRISRAPSFAIASVYPPKTFTPNIAPYENITFYVDNPQGDKVTGKVFGLNGSFVADLAVSGDATATTVILYWDGKNSDYEFVPKGVYLYQIEGSGKTINGTVIVAR